jgi:hypothetical protein
MEEYTSNSHKTREKRVEKVVKGNVRSKKKTEIQKLADVFISEDVANVKSYIIFDVLIPAAKRVISDTVDTLLYGESGRKGKSNSSKASYERYYDRSNSNRTNTPKTRSRSTYDYDEIVLDNRGEAEEVLSRMVDLVETYGLVSVADLYDLCGMSCNYTDNNYGWTDIRSANVVRVRDGYLIKLPRALPLN